MSTRLTGRSRNPAHTSRPEHKPSSPRRFVLRPAPGAPPEHPTTSRPARKPSSPRRFVLRPPPGAPPSPAPGPRPPPGAPPGHGPGHGQEGRIAGAQPRSSRSTSPPGSDSVAVGHQRQGVGQGHGPQQVRLLATRRAHMEPAVVARRRHDPVQVELAVGAPGETLVGHAENPGPVQCRTGEPHHLAQARPGEQLEAHHRRHGVAR